MPAKKLPTTRAECRDDAHWEWVRELQRIRRAEERARKLNLFCDKGYGCACETCERDAATLAKNETNEKEDHRAASGSRRGKTK